MIDQLFRNAAYALKEFPPEATWPISHNLLGQSIRLVGYAEIDDIHRFLQDEAKMNGLEIQFRENYILLRIKPTETTPTQ